MNVMGVESECLPFWGHIRDQDGYGQLRPAGARGTPNVLAHRHVWEECFGPVPEGMVLHHKCYNPACVMPDHLEPMTRAEHQRLHKADITHCPQGHEYTEENTYIRPAGDRQCRKCINARNRQAYHRRKNR